MSRGNVGAGVDVGFAVDCTGVSGGCAGLPRPREARAPPTPSVNRRASDTHTHAAHTDTPTRTRAHTTAARILTLRLKIDITTSAANPGRATSRDAASDWLPASAADWLLRGGSICD
ncbi:hypothetical protein JYU34_013504 [Plutella xylostella]|uniref:Uncharacterized protein n=1 Tax=Plutella xylostella TaxID=51655 RepID=A0ABQ7QA83_PLUXY|nr:hypothetical protein JYU34_013504 [Plutella xylostella]